MAPREVEPRGLKPSLSVEMYPETTPYIIPNQAALPQYHFLTEAVADKLRYLFESGKLNFITIHERPLLYEELSNIPAETALTVLDELSKTNNCTSTISALLASIMKIHVLRQAAFGSNDGVPFSQLNPWAAEFVPRSFHSYPNIYEYNRNGTVYYGYGTGYNVNGDVYHENGDFYQSYENQMTRDGNLRTEIPTVASSRTKRIQPQRYRKREKSSRNTTTTTLPSVYYTYGLADVNMVQNHEYMNCYDIPHYNYQSY